MRTVYDKVEKLEEKLGEMEEKLEEKMAEMEQKLEEKIIQVEEETKQANRELSEKVDTSVFLVNSVRDRQKVWMSEIRLISLYKPVDQNNPQAGHPMNVVTDGNFVHAK